MKRWPEAAYSFSATLWILLSLWDMWYFSVFLQRKSFSVGISWPSVWLQSRVIQSNCFCRTSIAAPAWYLNFTKLCLAKIHCWLQGEFCTQRIRKPKVGQDVNKRWRAGSLSVVDMNKNIMRTKCTTLSKPTLYIDLQLHSSIWGRVQIECFHWNTLQAPIMVHKVPNYSKNVYLKICTPSVNFHTFRWLFSTRWGN